MSSRNIATVEAGAWMMKPKAQKDGKSGGGLKGLFGGGGWNKRWVWVKNKSLCYGAKQGQSEKSIPLPAWRVARPMSPDDVKKAKGPADKIQCGWELLANDRVIQFACDSPDMRNAWVAGINELINTQVSDDLDCDFDEDWDDSATAQTLASTQQTLSMSQSPSRADLTSQQGSPTASAASPTTQKKAAAGEDGDDDNDDANMDWDDDDMDDKKQASSSSPTAKQPADLPQQKEENDAEKKRAEEEAAANKRAEEEALAAAAEAKRLQDEQEAAARKKAAEEEEARAQAEIKRREEEAEAARQEEQRRLQEAADEAERQRIAQEAAEKAEAEAAALRKKQEEEQRRIEEAEAERKRQQQQEEFSSQRLSHESQETSSRTGHQGDESDAWNDLWSTHLSQLDESIRQTQERISRQHKSERQTLEDDETEKRNSDLVQKERSEMDALMESHFAQSSDASGAAAARMEREHASQRSTLEEDAIAAKNETATEERAAFPLIVEAEPKERAAARDATLARIETNQKKEREVLEREEQKPRATVEKQESSQFVELEKSKKMEQKLVIQATTARLKMEAKQDRADLESEENQAREVSVLGVEFSEREQLVKSETQAKKAAFDAYISRLDREHTEQRSRFENNESNARDSLEAMERTTRAEMEDDRDSATKSAAEAGAARQQREFAAQRAELEESESHARREVESNELSFFNEVSTSESTSRQEALDATANREKKELKDALGALEDTETATRRSLAAGEESSIASLMSEETKSRSSTLTREEEVRKKRAEEEAEQARLKQQEAEELARAAAEEELRRQEEEEAVRKQAAAAEAAEKEALRQAEQKKDEEAAKQRAAAAQKKAEEEAAAKKMADEEAARQRSARSSTVTSKRELPLSTRSMPDSEPSSPQPPTQEEQEQLKAALSPEQLQYDREMEEYDDLLVEHDESVTAFESYQQQLKQFKSFLVQGVWVHKPAAEKSGGSSFLKLGGGWKRRYIQLLQGSNSLQYAEGPNKAAKGNFTYGEITDIKQLSGKQGAELKAPNKYANFCFAINTDEKNYTFACENAQDCKQFVLALATLTTEYQKPAKAPVPPTKPVLKQTPAAPNATIATQPVSPPSEKKEEREQRVVAGGSTTTSASEKRRSNTVTSTAPSNKSQMSAAAAESPSPTRGGEKQAADMPDNNYEGAAVAQSSQSPPSQNTRGQQQRPVSQTVYVQPSKDEKPKSIIVERSSERARSQTLGGKPSATAASSSSRNVSEQQQDYPEEQEEPYSPVVDPWGDEEDEDEDEDAEYQICKDVVEKGVWMHKPPTSVTSGSSGFFKIGGGWKRRYVWVNLEQGGYLYYGENENTSTAKVEKRIPLSSVTSAANISVRDADALKAPDKFARSSWQLVTEGKKVVFACEKVTSRDFFVNFFNLHKKRLLAPPKLGVPGKDKGPASSKLSDGWDDVPDTEEVVQEETRASYEKQRNSIGPKAQPNTLAAINANKQQQAAPIQSSQSNVYDRNPPQDFGDDEQMDDDGDDLKPVEWSDEDGNGGDDFDDQGFDNKNDHNHHSVADDYAQAQQQHKKHLEDEVEIGADRETAVPLPTLASFLNLVVAVVKPAKEEGLSGSAVHDRDALAVTRCGDCNSELIGKMTAAFHKGDSLEKLHLYNERFGMGGGSTSSTAGGGGADNKAPYGTRETSKAAWNATRTMRSSIISVQIETDKRTISVGTMTGQASDPFLMTTVVNQEMFTEKKK